MENKDLHRGVYSEDSPYSPQECDLIIKNIEDLLDETLSEEEAVLMMKKLNECAYCLEQYQVEKNIRKLLKSVRSQIKRQEMLTLRQNILDKIKSDDDKCSR